jgi:Lrp/AsnC family transcriptional regulator for asnA, asnC and gidA
VKYEIDSLDRKILTALKRDSRKPYLEIARELTVSGGTIHARVNRMKEAGLIRGTRTIIDYEGLGYGVAAFVGVSLARAGASRKIQRKLKKLPEVVEVHYTTGTYSLFVKVVVGSMKELHVLLAEGIQALDEIQTTETFVILDTSLERDVDITPGVARV